MTRSRTLIEVKAASYSYKNTKVLSDVNLTFNEGQFAAVIGPNGSGKSTLSKLLNALLLPSEGSVTVDGHSTADISFVYEIRKTVGLVLQNPDNQIIGDTVEDDVAFALENMGILPSWMDTIITDVLSRTGLSDLRFRNPRELSGGQKQLLAIASVLAMKPKCIVLDEALSMLDKDGRRTVLSLLHRLNKETGLSVILITQDVQDALEADVIFSLKGGTIKAFSAQDFPSPFVADLVSELRTRNLIIPEEVVSDDGLIRYLTCGGKCGA